MADSDNFSVRNSAGTLDGTELLPCQDGLESKKTTVAAVNTYIQSLILGSSVKVTDTANGKTYTLSATNGVLMLVEV